MQVSLRFQPIPDTVARTAIVDVTLSGDLSDGQLDRLAAESTARRRVERELQREPIGGGLTITVNWS
jgi:hypothetical protein